MMNPTDKFQERVGAAIGLLIVGSLVLIALVQTVAWCVLTVRTGQLAPFTVTFPEALLALASGIVGFYFGAKVGTVQLNGSVAKLAKGAQDLATAVAAAAPSTDAAANIGVAPPEQKAA